MPGQRNGPPEELPKQDYKDMGDVLAKNCQ